MKIAIRFALALATGAALATSAAAQTPPDPAKLKLAAEITEATGGQARVDELMKSMFAGMREVASSLVPQAQSGVSDVIQQDFQEQFRALTPRLLAVTQEAYARELTTQELQDMLAWVSSPSGRAIAAKLPVLQQDVLRAQGPILKAAMPTLMRHSLARICEVQRCTAEDRARLDEALAKIAPGD